MITLASVVNASCEVVMNKSFDYYDKLLGAIKGDKTHHDKFEENNRMDKFKKSMQRWGRKMDKNECICDGNAEETMIDVYISLVGVFPNPASKKSIC